MPQISDRQKQLRVVKQNLEFCIALQSSSSDSDVDSINTVGSLESIEITNFDTDTEDDTTFHLDSSSDSDRGEEQGEFDANPTDLFELYFVLYNTQYFVPRHVTTKSNEFATQFFHNLPDRLFRQLTRMSKTSFFHLLDLIVPHPIFQNNSNYDQTPIVRQLAVCLDRLGHQGNGACLNHMIPTWGVSNGSLINFSSRCFKALESVLADQISWPTRSERYLLNEEFAKHGFPGCVGLIDGSLLPLSQWPKAHGECYYDCKCNYSVNVQVVCDHRRKIIFMFTGMPGSCSDLTCVRRSPLWQYCTDVQSNMLFDDEQHIIGDSGYQALPHLVCAFKRADIVLDKEDFNTCVAKCCVTNEHCIGVLKSRWHSLKEIRVQLNKKKDSVWMFRWVMLCGKLHNYVMSQNDEWTLDDEEIELPEVLPNEEVGATECTGRVSTRGIIAAGNALLVRVMDEALAFNRQHGRFLWSPRE